MNKSELLQSLSFKIDIPEEALTQSVNEIISMMIESLSNNQRIEIRGFGSFILHYKASRNAHNPKTGDRVVTSPKYSPHFKPGKDLRDRVNASKDTVKIIETEI